MGVGGCLAKAKERHGDHLRSQSACEKELHNLLEVLTAVRFYTKTIRLLALDFKA